MFYKKLTQVTPSLYLSSDSEAANLELLRQHGITHIVNATMNIPEHFPLEFQYLTIRIEDCSSVDIIPHCVNISNWFKVSQNINSKLLFHCNYGISRSPALLIGSQMVSDNDVSFHSMFTLVLMARPFVNMNDGFFESLLTLDNKMIMNKKIRL